MILLRNLMLALAAFVITGVGFYSYLRETLPPEQLKAIETPATLITATLPDAEPLVAAPTSAGGLAAALVEDLLAVRRELAPATSTEKASGLIDAQSPSVSVPAWLRVRFEQIAVANGKALGAGDSERLMLTLLELRNLHQQMDTALTPQAGSDTVDRGLGGWGMSAVALQAELQFRRVLGVGLADFMKGLMKEDTTRLLALPAP